MKLQPQDLRVQRLLERQLSSPAFRFDDLTDPRDRRGRRWKIEEMAHAILLGQLAQAPSLRDVEALTSELGWWARKYVSRRLPDTTLWDLVPHIACSELRTLMVRQVRAAWRAKSLRPVGLPCGVLSIDGKGLGALEHDADGTAQKNHRQGEAPYWLTRNLRAVLTSAESKPCIDQMPIAAKTNEIGDFEPFFRRIVEDYGRGDLFEIVTGDAGLCSKKNATLIHEAEKAYVLALKENQPELWAEAQRLLAGRVKPDAETPWERYRGDLIRYRLYRTSEIAGYHDWEHLRQVWRVEKLIAKNDGSIEREDRYYLISVPWGRLSPMQILAVVRGHWGIENDCFWSLDTQWLEDSVPWCSKGRAVEVLSWFRLMAYNLLQYARRCHLRRRLDNGHKATPSPWRRIFVWVNRALSPSELVPVCG